MKHFLRYSFVALLAMFVGQMFAQEVTLDFTIETSEGSKESVWGFPASSKNKTVEEKSFTYNGITVKVAGSEGQGYYWHDKDHYLLFGKEGAYVMLPAFNFDVASIEVEGNSSASGNTKQNIFVGETAVSTETTGAQGTNTYAIAEAYQAAGTIYTIKVTSNHNDQIRTIKIYKKGDAPQPPTPEIQEINVAKALEIIAALEDGKTTADAYKVTGYVVGDPDFQRKTDGSLYGNVNFEMADNQGGTSTLTVFRAKDFENANFTEETINRFKAGDLVVVQGKLQKYVKNEVVTPELTNGYLISVTTPISSDTWTVAGTLPLVNKEWNPSDTSADMTSTDGVNFTYVKEDIVLEAGTNYEFKVVKNHTWDEAYPSSNYVVTVIETAKYKATIKFNATTKEISCETEKTGSAGPVTHTYSVIGTLVGDWDTDTEMTKDNDGLFKAVFENIAKGSYKFKVRADKSWSISYPAQDYQLTVDQDGSLVTVTFDEETKAVNATVSAGTGISTAKIVDLRSAQYFNIAGQKVTSSYKGLVIVNGKKIIQK
jgi:hypothetical protein